MDFDISTYLRDYTKKTRSGTCKVCQATVGWSRDRLAGHKRATCKAASTEEKELFAVKQVARQAVKSEFVDFNENDESNQIDAPSSSVTMLKRKEVDFEISTYLKGFSQKTQRGTCIACHSAIIWSRERVGAHKRASCSSASAEEKEFFALKKPVKKKFKTFNESDESNDVLNRSVTSPRAETSFKRKEIDFEISTYLKDFSKKTQRGTCRACRSAIIWSRERVGAHKRASCSSASAKEKEFFALKKPVKSEFVSFNESDESNDVPNRSVTSPKSGTLFKRKEMDFAISTYLQHFIKETRRGTCKACGLSVGWSKERVAAHKRVSCNKETSTEIEPFFISKTKTNFEVSTYLRNFNTETHRGTCKDCLVAVGWSKERVAAHKRATCSSASAEEKRRFGKRSSTDQIQPSDSNSDLLSEMDKCEFITFNENDELTNEPNEHTNEIDTKLGFFFFRTGISFRLADSEAFKDLLHSLNPAYANSMPSSETLAGTLLDQQYLTCSQKLEELLAESSNLNLVCDGWIKNRGDHIVKFSIKTPNQSSFFYSLIDTSGMAQNAQTIADSIVTVIEKIGPQKFCSVITENAAIMKFVWKLIESKFPHVSAYGCAAHSIDLLIKDILETPDNTMVIRYAEKIIKFVSQHRTIKAEYDDIRKAAKVFESISMPLTARCSSRYASLKGLCESKYLLMQLVNDCEQTLQDISTSAPAINLIASNEFWEKLDSVIKTVEFPANIISKLEAEDAPLSHIYHYFGEIFNHYKNEVEIQVKVKKQLDFMFTDVMGLAYLLTPKFAARGFFFDDDQPTFISLAKEFALGVNPTIAEQVEDEMIAFVTKISTLPQKQEDVVFKMSALTYWSVIGRREFPNLYVIAKPIVEMMSTSSTTERTSSTLKMIHSRLKNELTKERAEKLTFIYLNCPMFDEKDKIDYIFEDEDEMLSGSDSEDVKMEVGTAGRNIKITS